MPVHNAGEYLRPSLESVLGQTYQRLELIVVDDCSTDGATDFIASHGDPRIVYLRNEQNVGAAESRNRAIRQASGDFIAIQDADDLSHPERIATTMAVFRNQPDTDIVFGDHRLIDPDGAFIADVRLPTTPNATLLGFRSSQPFGHGSVTARRRRLDEAGGYLAEYEPAEDYALFAACLLAGSVFRGTGSLHYDYRLHIGGISAAAGRSASFESTADRRARPARCRCRPTSSPGATCSLTSRAVDVVSHG